jgi:hypothetical protein
MLNVLLAPCEPIEILTSERTIDAERSARPLPCGNDRELHP